MLPISDSIQVIEKTLDLVKWCMEKFKDFNTKDQVETCQAFENYLREAKKQNESVKTLLYRHSPKKLYDFYEKLDVENGEGEVYSSDVNALLELSHCLIITGTGGIGKSLLMKHLFLNCIETWTLIPILIELRKLNDFEGANLEEFMYNSLHKFKLEKKYFQHGLEKGCFLILLDGYDEVKSDIAQCVCDNILNLSKKYPENYYIVSSRPLEEFIGWEGFIELNAKVLSKEQALSFINKIDCDSNIKENFYQEVKESLYESHKSFASNPLLLSIMLLTFKRRMSIPNKLNDFYEEAFSALFHTHDATKCGYERELRSDLGYEDFKKIFSYICFKSFFVSDYEFSRAKIIEYITQAKKKYNMEEVFSSEYYLDDLEHCVCMLVKDGLDYKFSHRSFQEYFAALYTTQLEDNVQGEFLGKWLKGSRQAIRSNYLSMLKDLQPQRFEKNVLHPGLIEIREKISKDIYSFFEDLVIEICIYKDEILIRRTNNYYAAIISETIKLCKREIVSNEKAIREMVDILKNNYSEVTYSLGIDTESLKKDGLLKKFMDSAPQFKRDFDLVMKYLESMEEKNKLDHTSFDSILESL